MRHYLLPVVAAAALMGLAACSDNTSNETTQSTTPTTDQQRTSTQTGDQPVQNAPADRDPTPQTGTGGQMDTNTQQN